MFLYVVIVSGHFNQCKRKTVRDNQYKVSLFHWCRKIHVFLLFAREFASVDPG